MRILFASAAMAVVLGFSGAAHAQSTAIEGRVDRLEREMRAVQRKVFPGGAGQTLEPQITPETNTIVPGVPASSPVDDLTQRVAAIEGQISALTGQIEQSQYRVRQLEEAFSAYKSTTDARLKAVESGSAAVSSIGQGGPAPTEVAEVPLRPTRGGGKATTPVIAPAPVDTAPATAPAKPGTSARAEQVAAIEKPNTGDPAEDGYTYGYRLWSAKLYPEARRELESVVTKYPTHRRASYSQNLLGRAYLDAGAPSLAAVAFYQNYKTNPKGERAPDSLYYLADALTRLKKPASEVCKVYDELTQLYGAKLSAEMTAGVQKGRAAQKCQ